MRRPLLVSLVTLLLVPLVASPASAGPRITTSGSYPPLIAYSVLTHESGGSQLRVLDVRTGREVVVASSADKLLEPMAFRGNRVYYTEWHCCYGGPLMSVSSTGGSPVYENANGVIIDVSPGQSAELVSESEATPDNRITRKQRQALESTSDPSLGEGAYAHWTLDAKHIVFDRLIPESPGSSNGSTAVFVMNGDGSGVRQLTHSPQGVSDFAGRLSPDGTHLIYTHVANGDRTYSLYVSAADGRNPRQVTSNGRYPDWSRNSWLTYVKMDSKSHAQLAIRSPGSHPREWVLTATPYGIGLPRFQT